MYEATIDVDNEKKRGPKLITVKEVHFQNSVTKKILEKVTSIRSYITKAKHRV